jgi:hydrogenase maturation factor
MLEEPVVPGDWVIIHLGFAVEVVDQEVAERALSGLEMMDRARDEHGVPGP